MAMNPMQLVQMAERLRIFRSQNPNLEPGVVMELKVTDNNGKVSVTNIRLTPEDIETIEIIKSIRGDN